MQQTNRKHVLVHCLLKRNRFTNGVIKKGIR